MPDVLAVVNKKIFGGGIMSPSHSRHLRMIGQGEARRVEIEIESCSASQKRPNRIPANFADPLHPGGNSLCYAVQIAHLMGADQIVAVGFTLKSGSRYQHKGGNPATRCETARYGDISRPMSWLSWYCNTFPGKLALDVTFEGPLYELPETIAPRFRGEPDPQGQDGQKGERPEEA